MKIVNLLDFINKTRDFFVLEYSTISDDLIDFLDLIANDDQFVQRIDLGLVYLKKKSLDQYVVIDGINRILSLSLLLHAICECYKKTSTQNTKAIKIIRDKYIVKNSKYKLHLNESDDILYKKIISGERLSGKEKQKPIFLLFHKYWTLIKTDSIKAANIFNTLKKINITIVDVDLVSERDLYYTLNTHRKINQLSLIDDYLKEIGIIDGWINIKNLFLRKENDIFLFLRDFFITKFNYKIFKPECVYQNFVNYFETMLQYSSEEIILNKLKIAAELYSNILNINFKDDNIKTSFIKIREYGGVDTFPYLLDVYQDFHENNISYETFTEILKTIVEYLYNRKESNNNIDFNELVEYLNAFITCK